MMQDADDSSSPTPFLPHGWVTKREGARMLAVIAGTLRLWELQGRGRAA